MNAKAFFDTNIIVYAFSSNDPRGEKAEALLAQGGIISVQVLNEFASVATRKLKMGIAEVREVLATIRAVCSVKPVDIETHELALDLVERYRFSVYDGLILAAAALAGCTVLYTEDLRHRQRVGGVIISNPFAGY